MAGYIMKGVVKKGKKVVKTMKEKTLKRKNVRIFSRMI